MLYRVLIVVMYAAGGCVSAIMVWVAGKVPRPRAEGDINNALTVSDTATTTHQTEC